MKLLGILALLLGLAGAMALVFSHGVGEIWHAAESIGWGGFVLLLGIRLVLISAMGFNWWLLGAGRADVTLPRMVWGRLIRDSAGEALPLSQLGGYVLGARAAILAGVNGSFAAASTTVDVALELVGQLLYTALGLALFAWLRPGSELLWPACGGLVAMGLAVCLFFLLQIRGAHLAERALGGLTQHVLGKAFGSGGAVAAEIALLHQKRGRAVLSIFGHFLCWLLAGMETWLVLQLMGLHLPLAEALVVDSMLYGLRSMAFMVPNAMGVQEGGFILLGGMFGVPPDAALALSLIKRARDLVAAIPALLAWQIWEARRALKARAITAQGAAATPAAHSADSAPQH